VREQIHSACIFGDIFRVEPALLLALADVESGNKPDSFYFDIDGFNRTEEWHKIFDRHYGEIGTIPDNGTHGEKFKRATGVHEDHAHNSVMYGKFQLHGWNFFRLGYPDAKTMLAEWTDPHEQLKGFGLWLQYANPVYPMLCGKRASATSVGPFLVAARRAGSGDTQAYAKIARTGQYVAPFKEKLERQYALRKEQLALIPGFEKRGKQRGTRGYWRGSEHAFVKKDLRGKPAPRVDRFCHIQAGNIMGGTMKEIVEGFLSV